MTDFDTTWQRALNKALDAGKTYAEASRMAYTEAKPPVPHGPARTGISGPPVNYGDSGQPIALEAIHSKSRDELEIERLQGWLYHFAKAYSWHTNDVAAILNGKKVPEPEPEL